MKKIILFCSVCLFVLTAFNAYSGDYSAKKHSFDVVRYKALTQKNIGIAISNSPDINEMKKDMQTLIDIAIEGCKKHHSGTTESVDKKILDLVIENIDSIKSLSVDEAEEKWIDKGIFRENNLAFEDSKLFFEIRTHAFSAIFPAVSIVLLNAYEKEKDPDLLDQVKNQLEEMFKYFEAVKRFHEENQKD